MKKLKCLVVCYLIQATPMLSQDKIQNLINGEYPLKSAAKFAAVAALYVQDEPDFRPNMSIVVRALQPLLKVAPAPVDTCG